LRFVTQSSRLGLEFFKNMTKKLLGEWRCASSGFFHQESLLLSPGESSPKHYHEQTLETYMVVQGTGEICVRHECIAVLPGIFIPIPERTIHQIKNTGEDDLLIISTKNQRASFKDFHEVT
jgi:mannose-6-phosphate isomerase-like protein (cupin superfamily)